MNLFKNRLIAFKKKKIFFLCFGEAIEYGFGRAIAMNANVFKCIMFDGISRQSVPSVWIICSLFALIYFNDYRLMKYKSTQFSAVAVLCDGYFVVVVIYWPNNQFLSTK